MVSPAKELEKFIEYVSPEELHELNALLQLATRNQRSERTDVTMRFINCKLKFVLIQFGYKCREERET